MNHAPKLPPGDIEQFSNIPVTVEARFHQRLMDLRDVLAIQPGAVISLDQAAGETLSVFVANVLLASAEVLVVEEQLAIRITEFRRAEV